MVRALVSRSSGPGLSPDRGLCVVFLVKTLLSGTVGVKTPTVPFSIQVYITGEFNGGVALRWTSNPSRGEYKHS